MKEEKERYPIYHYTTSKYLSDILANGLVTNKNYHRSEEATWQRYISCTRDREIKKKVKGKYSLFNYCDLRLELVSDVHSQYEVIKIDYTKFAQYDPKIQQHILRNDYEVYQEIKEEAEREQIFTNSRAFYLNEQEVTVRTDYTPTACIKEICAIEPKSEQEHEQLKRLCEQYQIPYKGENEHESVY